MPFDRALSVGYGDIDAYGFHTLEVLQCMVERRRGAEKGISAVQFLEGEAVWKWRDSEEGSWSAPLLKAALARSPDVKPGLPGRIRSGRWRSCSNTSTDSGPPPT